MTDVGSIDNLRRWFALADARDHIDGRASYRIYQMLIREIAVKYGHPFERVLAAFVALSPNSDYLGNLRSLISLLEGIKNGVPCHRIVVSTYNHCRDRAWDYLWGRDLLLRSARGLKIRSFFLNIFDPDDPIPVTVDGHIFHAWTGNDEGVMQGAVVRPRMYASIAHSIRRIARTEGLVANQVQATIWHTRKRVLMVKFDPQLDLFAHPIAVRLDEIFPYTPTPAPVTLEP